MPKAQLLKPGDKAPDFTLPGVDGTTTNLASLLPRYRAVVVMFICNHCPYVKAYIPRLIDLQNEFAEVVQLVGICSNDPVRYSEDDFNSMKQAARTWGLNFPYLHDGDQKVALAYGAQRTPEVFVLDESGVCRYEGGIDNNWQDAGNVTHRPLREALAAMAVRQPVKAPHSWAIGCTIKWKAENKPV